MNKEKIVVGGYVRFSSLLASLQKSIEMAKTENVGKLNLKNGEVFLMYVLYDNANGLSAEQLSKMCKVDRSFVSRAIKSLSKKNFIYVDEIPEGKRRYNSKLYMTELGKMVGEVLHGLACDIQRYVDTDIPQEDINIMYRTLDKIQQNFDKLNKAVNKRKKTDANMPV